MSLLRTIACLVLLLGGSPVSGQQALPPAAPEVVEGIQGSLVIVGGGGLPDAVRDRFVELAGGKSAKLVVIPTAGAPADDADAGKRLEFWNKLGVASAVLLHTRQRDQADDPAFVRPLTEATGVWLDGGDQSRLAAAYHGTAVERELHRLLGRGGVVGGTSAGAAVLSGLMIAGGNPRAQLGEGFGLLPGVVIDQHFLKRDRVNRLFGVLAEHPGYAGLGVDEQTAFVVRGRRLSVLGSSYALLCLPACTNRRASIQVLKAGDQADLVALCRAAYARSRPPFPPEHPEPPRVEHGTLLIGGGGGLSPEIWKRFLDLAGGPDAPIVVVPTAMEGQIPAEPGEVRALKRAGATNVTLLHTRKRSEANSPEFVSPLRQAKGVWFTGGRQWHLVDAYQDTATERAFHDVLRRGGVIGGSSAGASIQSEYMPRGNPLGNRDMMAEGYERGFGFLKGVAVDQHFFARHREHDMTELVNRYPQLLGLGIDEGTAIVVHGSVMDVVGKSKVAVYDRRKPVRGAKDYEEVPAGARYDLVARRPLDDR